MRVSSSRDRGGRTRTCNPRFWRPVLCQLSYAPQFGRGLYPPARARFGGGGGRALVAGTRDAWGASAAARSTLDLVPLGVLFSAITPAFGGIAVASAVAGQWPIAVAAGA